MVRLTQSKLIYCSIYHSKTREELVFIVFYYHAPVFGFGLNKRIRKNCFLFWLIRFDFCLFVLRRLRTALVWSCFSWLRIALRSDRSSFRFSFHCAFTFLRLALALTTSFFLSFLFPNLLSWENAEMNVRVNNDASNAGILMAIWPNNTTGRRDTSNN